MFKLYNIAFPNHIEYIIAPSSLAGRGLGVGLLYLTQLKNSIIKLTFLKQIITAVFMSLDHSKGEAFG
jgi:hypothetical protein